VRRTLNDEVTILRLPKPPKPAQIEFDDATNRPSRVEPVAPRVSPVGASKIASLYPTVSLPAHRPEPAPQRPSLEGLLAQAEYLANTLSVSDPRGQLLQVALLRRDHTLIEAIVRAVGPNPPCREHRTVVPDNKQKLTLRPLAKAKTRRHYTTERPAARSRRAR
jgi:hypothetical protein